MGAYSPEPPRKNCIVHHTFDSVEIDRVIDYSPQGNDGQIVGDVDFKFRGVVGNAARLKDNEANVQVSELGSYFPVETMTVTSWSRSEFPVDGSKVNLQFEFTIGTNTYTLTHTNSDTTSVWQFGGAVYDGSNVKLYYGTESGGEITVVDSVSVTGKIDTFNLTFETSGHGFVDDTRLYRTNLTETEIENIYEIATEHQTVDDVGKYWDNKGIPFRQTNKDFGGALAEEDDSIFRQLDYITEARHVNTAGGAQLDAIGRIGGIGRNENESDAHYRARIQARISAGRSSGTHSRILEAVQTILDTTKDRIELQYGWEQDPNDVATAYVYLRGDDLDEAELTATEVKEIIKDVVVAGHDIDVFRQGANPFTVRNDTQTNDPSLGLTSDSISTGGGLVSDV